MPGLRFLHAFLESVAPMIAIPAVDLREGACVQLVGGNTPTSGFGSPILSLSRATGRDMAFVDCTWSTSTPRPGEDRTATSLRTCSAIRRRRFRSAAAFAARRRSRSCSRVARRAVVVGTRALEDSDWLARVATTYPNEILVAADVRDRRVVTHGWARTLPREIIDVTEELSTLPLAGLLVTAVHREGRMQGADLFLMEDVVDAASFPVFASGGIASTADLRALDDRGVAAAIIGMALYTGALDPWQTAEEFSE